MSRFKECLVPQSVRIRSFYTAFKATFQPEYNFSGESHDFWEMVLVLEGKVGVCAGNGIYTLMPGDMILHIPMEFHRIWNENRGESKIIIITFGTDSIPKLTNRIFKLNEELVCEAENLLGQIYENYENTEFIVIQPRKNKLFEAELCAKRFEFFLLECINTRAVDSLVLEEGKSKSAQLYGEIVEFLSDNLKRNMNVDEIAAECNMSRSNLKKIFAKYSGIGVMKYFNIMKMKKAESYLKLGYSVGSVAEMFGYSDQNYFSTVFKRIMGYPPTGIER